MPGRGFCRGCMLKLHVRGGGDLEMCGGAPGVMREPFRSATASTRAIAALAVSLPDATMSSVARRCVALQIGQFVHQRSRSRLSPMGSWKDLAVSFAGAPARRLSPAQQSSSAAWLGSRRACETNGGRRRLAHRSRAKSPQRCSLLRRRRSQAASSPSRRPLRRAGPRGRAHARVLVNHSWPSSEGGGSAFRQKDTRLPQRIRRLTQAWRRRWRRGPFRLRRRPRAPSPPRAQRFERALHRPAHRLDRDRGRAKRGGIEVFRERRASLWHKPLDQAGERAHQRQQHGDADHIVGGVIGGEQGRRIDTLATPGRSAA